MKRFLTLVLAMLAVSYGVFGCSSVSEEARRLSRIGKELGLDLSAGTLVSFEDDHGGFHGDGESFAEVEAGGLEERLAGVLGWKPLPMPENVARAVRLTGMDGLAEAFDGINEGFYYFYDRHSKSEDPYDDSKLHSRASWNFTIAVYDGQSSRLYFYQLDT